MFLILDASHHLCIRTLSAGSILFDESRLWLDGIYRRLSGRVSIRTPYKAEIVRSIPYGVFSTCHLVVRDLRLHEPNVFIASNRKGEVISFTSLNSLIKFLSCISVLNAREIKKYFSRILSSVSRHNHKVAIIVSEEEDFAFVYNKNKGQLAVQFHYGEWNSNGFPRHRCANKLMKYTNVDS